MKLTIPVLFLIGILAGCATSSPEEVRAADEAKCTGYGFQKGSEFFAECLQRIELDRRAEDRAMLISLGQSRPTVIYQAVPVKSHD